MSGEGELTFKQLLDCLENKQEINVEGVSYQGDIVHDIALFVGSQVDCIPTSNLNNPLGA